MRLAVLRAELKRQEAEQLAAQQQQEAQRSTWWNNMLKQVQPQKAQEHSAQEKAFLAAKARERKLQEVLGPPPVPPPVPKGKLVRVFRQNDSVTLRHVTCTSCVKGKVDLGCRSLYLRKCGQWEVTSHGHVLHYAQQTQLGPAKAADALQRSNA